MRGSVNIMTCWSGVSNIGVRRRTLTLVETSISRMRRGGYFEQGVENLLLRTSISVDLTQDQAAYNTSKAATM